MKKLLVLVGLLAILGLSVTLIACGDLTTDTDDDLILDRKAGIWKLSGTVYAPSDWDPQDFKIWFNKKLPGLYDYWVYLHSGYIHWDCVYSGPSGSEWEFITTGPYFDTPTEMYWLVPDSDMWSSWNPTVHKWCYVKGYDECGNLVDTDTSGQPFNPLNPHPLWKFDEYQASIPRWWWDNVYLDLRE